MYGVAQSNGTEIDPKDWVHIKFSDGREYIGRFSGVYENPTLGVMYYLSFARPVDGSKPADTLWCPMRESNDCEEALNNAVVIEKPVKRKGKLLIIPRRPAGSVLH